MRRVLVVLNRSVFAAAFLVTSASTPALAGVGAAALANMKMRLADVPLSFEENVGQTDASVKFLARGPGYAMFLSASEAVIVLKNRPSASEESRSAMPCGLLRRGGHGQTQDRARSAPEDVLRITLAGAEAHANVTGLDELPGKANYFIGSDPRRWRANVPTYARVRYRGVYPGVDVVYNGNGRQLEHDIVVAPGADPDIVKLAFDNATRVDVDSAGDVVVTLPGGTIRQKKPVVYQEIQGARTFIDTRYVVNGKDVSVLVAADDRSIPLVIDSSSTPCCPIPHISAATASTTASRSPSMRPATRT